MLKPWDDETRSPTEPAAVARATPVEPTAPPTPTRDPALVAAASRRECLSGNGWRLLAQTTGELGARTLWDVSALATTPAGADEEAHQLYARDVVAIGYCPPGATLSDRRELVADVVLWRLRADGILQEVGPTQEIDPLLANFGEIYLGPDPTSSTGGSWPPGDYLFQVRPITGGTYGWFALKVIAPG